MKIPRKLRIGPHTFIVKTDDESVRVLRADPARGDCVPHDQVIRVDPERPESGVAETLMHETLHGIWDVSGLRAAGCDDDEEQIVTTFAPWLVLVLRDNPKLVKVLLGE